MDIVAKIIAMLRSFGFLTPAAIVWAVLALLFVITNLLCGLGIIPADFDDCLASMLGWQWAIDAATNTTANVTV